MSSVVRHPPETLPRKICNKNLPIASDAGAREGTGAWNGEGQEGSPRGAVFGLPVGAGQSPAGGPLPPTQMKAPGFARIIGCLWECAEVTGKDRREGQREAGWVWKQESNTPPQIKGYLCQDRDKDFVFGFGWIAAPSARNDGG